MTTLQPEPAELEPQLIPEGYLPWTRSSPFLDAVGPLYTKAADGVLWLGVRVDARHVNRRGLAHGGFLATLADMLLGYSLATAREGLTPMLTTQLSLDFAGSAKLGDWIEGSADVQKVGRLTAFANAYLRVGQRRIVRASGIFVIT